MFYVESTDKWGCIVQVIHRKLHTAWPYLAYYIFIKV